MKTKFLFFLLFPILSFCQNLTSEEDIKTIVENTEFSFLIKDSYSKWRDSDYSGAILNLDKIIEKDTINCSWPYTHRAFFKYLNEDYDGAILDYTYAIKNQRKCEFHYAESGIVHATIDLTEKDLYFQRGKANMKANKFSEAVFDFSEVVSIDNSLSEAFFMRGKAKLFLGDYRGAISDCNLAVNLKHTFQYNSEIYFYRGCAKYNINNYQEALLDLNKYIELCKNDSFGYIQRGLIKIAMKQKDSACIDFSIAGEKGNEEAYEMIHKYCN